MLQNNISILHQLRTKAEQRFSDSLKNADTNVDQSLDSDEKFDVIYPYKCLIWKSLKEKIVKRVESLKRMAKSKE